MNLKQRILKLLYPLTMRSGINNKKNMNDQNKKPATSLYDLSITLNNGTVVPLSHYKGKKVLIVNTASNCGYTPQYEQLQELYEQNKQGLEVIGFPANDFKEQEKGSDEEIASFCKVNYGVTFPLARKSSVIKSPDQHPVFEWLTHSKANGWNDAAPSWNFCKFLVDEQGNLLHFFEAGVSPTGSEIVNAVKQH